MSCAPPMQVLGVLWPDALASHSGTAAALLNHGEPTVRCAALDQIAKLSLLVLAPLAPTVVEQLRHPDRMVRCAALRALRRLESEQLMLHAAAIVPLAGDSDAEVRDAGARILNSKLNPHASRSTDAAQAFAQKMPLSLLLTFLRHDESLVRDWSATCLALLEPVSFQPCLAEINQLATDVDVEVQRRAKALMRNYEAESGTLQADLASRDAKSLLQVDNQSTHDTAQYSTIQHSTIQHNRRAAHGW